MVLVTEEDEVVTVAETVLVGTSGRDTGIAGGVLMVCEAPAVTVLAETVVACPKNQRFDISMLQKIVYKHLPG